MATKLTAQLYITTLLFRTFLRGQNVMIDPDTQKEMEEKRKRHLEHQEYIKKQVGNSDIYFVIFGYQVRNEIS